MGSPAAWARAPATHYACAVRIAGALNALRRGRRPVRFGSLRRTDPVSDHWGFDRGTPVDRWYIERFLESRRGDITGRVVEVKDSGYTNAYGSDLTERAVLDIDPANPEATIVGDLASGEGIPDGRFDCFVLTQTLHLVEDPFAGVRNAARALRAGGVLLLTVPVTSRLCEPPITDRWRFTPLGLSTLFEREMPGAELDVRGHGNLLAQVAFLEGLAAEELTRDELERHDERFPLLVSARAVKPA